MTIFSQSLRLVVHFALILILHVHGFAGAALAQGGPANGVWLREFPPPTRDIALIVEDHGSTFTARTQGLGILRSPTTLPLHDSTPLNVRVDLVVRPHGYNLIYTIRNRTGKTHPLPTLSIAGHEFGDQISYLDHRFGLEWRDLDVSGGNNAFTARSAYPTTLYCPAVVMCNYRLALGASLVYDIMGYQHSIRTQISRGPRGSRWDSWTIKFFLDGEIRHGHDRTYTVMFKYNRQEDWIHTLEPYRDHFQAKWGPVRYQQDMRPVYGDQIGDTGFLAPDNRLGMKPNRADLNGWQAEVNDLLDYAVPNGYKRAMVWTPSGMYYINRHNNFPPQVMSEWTLPMVSTALEWHRVGQAGIDLYFWWGRSAQTSDRWDPQNLGVFNIHNVNHYTRMMNEWLLAIQRGAIGMGLDKFTLLPAWDAIPWLEDMSRKKPGSRFIVEPSGYDIIHVFQPTFIQARHLDQQNCLADYLVPGREMWVHLVGPDATTKRALEVIDWGMTVITKTKNISAHDLEDAIRRAQGR